MGRSDSGMTLMEMLIVIAILGLLTAMVLPVGSRMDNDAKEEETLDLLESIRFALVGAEHAYDENGNRVIGGYVGDFGKLPDLIVHQWDETEGEWVVPKNTDDSPQTSEDVDNSLYTKNLMPVGLWQKTVKLEDDTHYAFVEDTDKWHGPYLGVPRDDTPDDDDLFTYTDEASPGSDKEAENRRFFLRQGKGRLVDGWGSSLLVYMHEDDLVFVSAGSDRRINYGDDEDEDYDPVHGAPADLGLKGNDDNLVLGLTHEQWDLTDQEVAATRRKLKDLRAAILGRTTSYLEGESQPTGYGVDMGGLETLLGSYVYKAGAPSTIYKCIRRHKSDSANGPGNGTYWEEADAGDYPYAKKWDDGAGRTYHGPQWQLLVMNADYVWHDDDGDGERQDGEYYRCTGNTSGSFSSDHWVKDDTFAGCDWVQEYRSSGMDYNNAAGGGVLPTWKYYPNVQFGAGWRGPYATYGTKPLTDAWGNPVRVELHQDTTTNTIDDDGSITLISYGPDGESDPDEDTDYDDLSVTIVHTDYATPVKVKVSGSKSIAEEDYVSIYTAYNGGVGYFNALGDGDGGTTATFNFNRNGEHFKESPTTVAESDDITDELAGYAPGNNYKNGPWVPVGWVVAVYRDSATNYTSPAGYQKIELVKPRANIQTITIEE